MQNRRTPQPWLRPSTSYRGPDLNRHGPCGPQDFKSCASTNSATPADLYSPPSAIVELRSSKAQNLPSGYPCTVERTVTLSLNSAYDLTTGPGIRIRVRLMSFLNHGINREAPGGFEPPHKGFADLSLTTWVRRQCDRTHPSKIQIKPRHLVGLWAAGPLLRGSV